jgi:hypothetical protein
MVLGAVFSAVFSALGGFGVARVVVRDFFAAGAALVRFIAGDADLARVDDDARDDVDEPRDEAPDAALRAREPDAGAVRDVPLRIVVFFADVLADFFAVFVAAPFARFDFE